MPARTSPTTTDEAFARALAMERAMHRRAAARVADVPGAFAFLRPEIERAYTENAFWVTDPAGRDAGALEREADHFMGGQRHRMFLVEGDAADALDAGFRALGYSSALHVYMAHSLDAAGLDAGPAVEVDAEELLPQWDLYLRTDPATQYGRDDETRDHLVEHHRTYGARAGVTERHFGVRDDGSVVAWAKLWERDGAAQVEDVVCLAEHRGKGYGRAVVSAAILAALGARPEPLFIVADADDWPKDLYRALGFEPVGTVREFVRGG